jgi:glutamine synthetase
MLSQEVLKLVKEKDVQVIDLKFGDFPGTWQHFTIPVSQATPDIFDEGLGFDGSAWGWQAIHASDMLVVPTRIPPCRSLRVQDHAVDDLQHRRSDDP